MSDIKITMQDLKSPKIDEIINLEQSLQRMEGTFVEDVATPFHLNPIFYYTIAAGLGAFLAWFFVEPYFSDRRPNILMGFLLFAGPASTIGLFLGIVYGIANRNTNQILYCGAIGAGVGLLLSFLTVVLGGFCFSFMRVIAFGLQKGKARPSDGFPLGGMAFFVHMTARGLAWGIVAIGAGLGLGISLKSKKLMLNGLVGAVLGGILGGMLFDPVHRFFYFPGEADMSRAVGITAIGILVGLFTGIFENLSKDAWLLMIEGPLRGKQFNIFKSPLVIGSAPKCDVYLFKDAGIDPRHATITKSGNKYLLQDEKSRAGIFVNGNRIDKYMLQAGDVIRIGKTVLKYQERHK